MEYEKEFNEQLNKYEGKQKDAFKEGVQWVLRKLEQIDE